MSKLLNLARKYGKGKPVSKAHGGGLAYRVPAYEAGGETPPPQTDFQKQMGKVGNALGQASQGSPVPPPPKVPDAHFAPPQMPNLFGGSGAGGPAPWDKIQTGIPGKAIGGFMSMDGDMSGMGLLRGAMGGNGPQDINPGKPEQEQGGSGPSLPFGRPMGAGALGALNPWAQSAYDHVFASGGRVGYDTGGVVDGAMPDPEVLALANASNLTPEQIDRIKLMKAWKEATGPGFAPGGMVGGGTPLLQDMGAQGYADGGETLNALPPRQGLTEEDMLALMQADPGAQGGSPVPDYLKTQQREGIPGAAAPEGLVNGIIGAGEMGAELTGIPSIVRGYNTISQSQGDPWKVAKGGVQVGMGAMPGMALTREGAPIVNALFGSPLRSAGTLGLSAVPDTVVAAKAGEAKQAERVNKAEAPAYLKEELTTLQQQKDAKQREFNALNEKYKKAGPETQRQALDPLRNDLSELNGKIKDAETRIREFKSGVAEKERQELPFRDRYPGAAEGIQGVALAAGAALPFGFALKNRLANYAEAKLMGRQASHADDLMRKGDVPGFADTQRSLSKRADRLDDATSFTHAHALPVAKAAAMSALGQYEASAVPEQVDALAFPPGHPTREAARAEFTNPDYYKSRVFPALTAGLATGLAGHEGGVLVTPAARVPDNARSVIDRGSQQSISDLDRVGQYMRALEAAKARPPLGARPLAAEEAQATALPANAELGQRPALGAPLGAQRPNEQPPADIPQPGPTASPGAPRPSDPTSIPQPGTPSRTEATSPPLGAGLGQTASPGTTLGAKGPGSGEQSPLPPPLGAKPAAEPPAPTPAPAPSRGIDTSAESPFGGAPIGSTQPGPTAPPAAGQGTPSRPSSSPVPPSQGLPKDHRWVFNPRTGVYQVHNAQGDFVPTPKDIAAPATKRQSKAGTSKRASKKSDPDTTRRDGGAIITARRYGGRIGGFIRKAFGGGLAAGGVPPGHEEVKVGPIVGETGGREDALPISVKSGSFVIPADVVAALGGGNSLAGMKSLQQQFGSSDPGDAVGPDVPIKISDGEYVIGPQEVAKIGNGDVSKGHRVLDRLVLKIRAEHIRTLKSLPGPRQD